MPDVTPASDDHKRRLAVEVLRRGGTIRLRAWGTSMLPIVWPGDILNIESGKGSFAIGDIVLISRDERFFVHRLIDFREDCHQWVARGDALLQSDPPVSESQVLGRVTTISKGNNNLVPYPQLSVLHRALGLILGYSDRCRSLALRLHSAGKPACRA